MAFKSDKQRKAMFARIAERDKFIHELKLEKKLTPKGLIALNKHFRIKMVK